MKDKELQPIVDKLKAYKEDNILSAGNSSKIDKIIEMIDGIEPSRISIPNVSMSDSTKAQMIKFFYDNYYNTSQDTVEFSKEFYAVVGEISMGLVPIKLEFLIDYLEDLVEQFEELNFQDYPEVIKLIEEEKDNSRFFKGNKKVDSF